MTEQKQFYEPEIRIRALQQSVLGDLSIMERMSQLKNGDQRLDRNSDIEITIKRLIAHLKEKK